MRVHRARWIIVAALAFGFPGSLLAVSPRAPQWAGKDLSSSFPVTPVGQTSTLPCLGLCFGQSACDATGTMILEKAVAPPFAAGNFRRGSADACGGTPVALPTTIGPGQALWFDASFSPTRQGTFDDSLRLTGFNFFFSGSTGASAGCAPNATTLCVEGNRFAVSARWTTANGSSGEGHAVALTADTGYFWFFSESNVEMVIKVLDACTVNQRFWVFAGGLTDVRVDITVRDTLTGIIKTYRNPQGTVFRPIQDTAAFASCSSSAAAEVAEEKVGTPTGTVLPVNGGRFRISAAWRTANGQSGAGQAVQLTDETGYFWFFSQDNVEAVIKVLDACGVNQKFWVFAAGLTDVQVDISVLDTATGSTRTYRNPQGTDFQPVADTSAFACGGGGGGLPPDPGEAGRTTLAGIDSDRDGVRDDLQRYIALTYPGSAATIGALRQTAKVVQGAVIDSASANASIDHATDLARALECLQAVRPADAAQVHLRLIAQTLDTEARGLAYLAFNGRLGGAVFPLSPVGDRASSCNAASAAGLRALGIEVKPKALSCQQTATVFFVNGMFNDCATAQVSTSALQDALLPLLTAEERANVAVNLACNPKGSNAIVDIWRVTRQYFAGNFTAFFLSLVGIELVPNPLLQALLDAAVILNAATVVDDAVLQQHVGKYRDRMLHGQKVVVTSHSQGNFYSNFASRSLTAEERESFGIVAVASPADHVEGGWAWTTLVTDAIMAAVPFSLPSNVFNGSQTAFDLTGHQFVLSYLAPNSASRSRILDQVVEEVRTLPAPDRGAGNGIITVTLTWNGSTDVDLHVFEPSGTHVYYRNLEGDVGFLDVDNVIGFGPEHYFVGCDTLVPGVYRVGVNYYRGSAPEVAHIQVAAGLVSRAFDIALPVALGTGGDPNPRTVVDIVVSGNATTGFTFDVQPRL